MASIAGYVTNGVEFEFEIVDGSTTYQELLDCVTRALIEPPRGPAYQTIQDILRPVKSNSEVITFTRHLIKALEEDWQKKTGLVATISSWSPFSKKPSFAPLMEIVSKYFDVKNTLDTKFQHLGKIPSSLKLVKEHLGQNCLIAFLRLILNSFPYENDKKTLLNELFRTYFDLEQPNLFQELVFESTAWKEAPIQYIELLETQVSNFPHYVHRYFPILKQALETYFISMQDVGTLYTFVESQLSINQADTVVSLLNELIKNKCHKFHQESPEKTILLRFLDCYTKLSSLIASNPIGALRMAFFLQTHAFTSSTMVDYEHPTYTILTDDKQHVLLVRRDESLPPGLSTLYCKIGDAYRMSLPPAPLTVDLVRENRFTLIKSDVSDITLPIHLIEIAQLLESSKGIVPIISSCLYNRGTNLSFFVKQYSKSLKDFIGGVFSRNEQIIVAHTLAQGLFAMHSQHILHSRISLESALVKIGSTGIDAGWELQDTTCMIIDLGGIKQCLIKNKVMSAPELFRRDTTPIDFRVAEMWSFGYVLFMLTEEILPWKLDDKEIEGKYAAHTETILSKNDRYLTWIWRILNPNPHERPALEGSLAILEGLVTAIT